MDLLIPDPYEDLYAFEASLGTPVYRRPVPRSKVEAVDKLLSKVGGRQTVSTESDWVALEEVIRTWVELYPEEYREFKWAIGNTRESRRTGGYSESKDSRFVGAIPLTLNKFIKIIFPYQQWDKKFSNSLVKRFKMFDVGGQVNGGKGSIQVRVESK